MAEQEKCAVEGCEETELFDLTPAAWPDGTGGIYACNKHYRQVASELECDFTLLLALFVKQFMAELDALRPIQSNALCQM